MVIILILVELLIFDVSGYVFKFFFLSMPGFPSLLNDFQDVIIVEGAT